MLISLLANPWALARVPLFTWKGSPLPLEVCVLGYSWFPISAASPVPRPSNAQPEVDRSAVTCQYLENIRTLSSGPVKLVNVFRRIEYQEIVEPSARS